MAYKKWQPGHLYPTGSIVEPLTAPDIAATPITNPGFETGDTSGWTVTANAAASNARRRSGAYGLRFTGSAGVERHISDDRMPINPGVKATGACWYHQGDASSGKNTGAAILVFYDAGLVEIPNSQVTGNAITSSNGGFKQSTATGVAPATAAHVSVGIQTNRTNSQSSNADDFSLNFGAANNGLLFKAVQPATGYSGSGEPNWPVTNGVQVIDNEVTWEAFYGTRVTYKSRAILKSGPTEPLWPTIVGDTVADGTIKWELSVLHIDDVNCPHSKYVVIAKSKVFALDRDIAAYCATLNARDWTSKKDAGFLGIGLSEGGDNDFTAMGLYRGNLVTMNSADFQQWQIDPDPELMSQLDDMPGIGSVWHLAIASIAGDMFYLSNLGVRTIGISGASNNLKAGDVGLPVDTLVQDLVAKLKLDPDEQPIGFFFPSSGQYWLVFNLVDDLTSVRRATVMVYTLNQIGQVGAWSRYEFPFAIDYAAQKGDDLYVRDGDTVFRLSDQIGTCDYFVDGYTPTGTPFDAIIQFPWLDMGAVGADKDLESYNVVGEGQASIEIGYSQTEPGYFTPPYLTPADTLPGTPIPMPLCAPSFSVRLTYHGWDPADAATEQNRFWQFIAVGLEFAQ